MCTESCILQAAAVPALEDHDLTQSLYELLDSEYGLVPAWSEQLVEATVLPPEDATHPILAQRART